MYDTVLLTIFGICMLILLNMARLEIRDQLRAKRKRALLAFARKLKKMFKKPAPD